MSTFPKLKLTYFNAAGRAEATRLAFHIGGVPFVDDRLTGEEFAQRKPNFVYGQLPVLKVDGVEMAQSQAILRYAGKIAGLYPVNDPIADMQVDEILSALDELLAKIGPSMRENDAEKKKAMRVDLANATIPRYLSQIDARLAEMKKSAVFQDEKIFIHELSIYSQLTQLRSGRLDDIPTDIADGHVEFMAAANKVWNHPKVQHWYAMHAAPELPTLKLTYFDGPARAESIRLAFVIGGIPFEDERVERNEAGIRRETRPYGQLPVLEVNGKVLAQSHPILRYAGTLAGLYPTNDPVLALRIDEMLCFSDDISSAFASVAHMEFSEAKKEAAKTLTKVTLPRLVDIMDKRIASWGGPYAVGSTMTIADLVVYAMVINFDVIVARGVPAGFPKPDPSRMLPTVSIEPFKNVQRVYAQVSDHDKVKAWLAKK